MPKIVKISIAALSLAIVIFAAVFFWQDGNDYFYDKVYPLEYYDYVTTYSEKYNVDKALIYGIMKTESNFDPEAKSSAGALGLMQIMPDTFKWLQTYLKEGNMDESDLYNPEINIRYGVYFISLLLKVYKAEEVAICAYNAGFGNVDKWLDNSEYSVDGVSLSYIPFKESRDYVGKVLNNKFKYDELYFEN